MTAPKPEPMLCDIHGVPLNHAIPGAMWCPKCRDEDSPPRKAVAGMTLAECVEEGCGILEKRTDDGYWLHMPVNCRAALVACELAEKFRSRLVKFDVRLDDKPVAETVLRAMLEWARG